MTSVNSGIGYDLRPPIFVRCSRDNTDDGNRCSVRSWLFTIHTRETLVNNPLSSGAPRHTGEERVHGALGPIVADSIAGQITSVKRTDEHVNGHR
jgi:hypothetical protein